MADYHRSGRKTPGRAFWRFCGQMAGSLGVFFLVLTIFQSTSPGSISWQSWLRQSFTADADLAPVMQFFYQWDIPYEEAAVRVNASPHSVQETMAVPVNGKVLTGCFDDETQLASRFEEGIWIDAEPDETICAAYSGTVTGIWEEAGTSIVEVSHANGLITIYGNCGEYYVQLDEPVEKGQALGHTRKKENRGTFYFAARYLGEPVNPMELINQKTAASS